MLAPTVPLSDPNPPLMDEIRVLRVRDGKEVSEALWVEWHAPYAMLPGALVLASGWDGRTWAAWRKYDVREAERVGDVRLFRLGRDEDSILLQPLGSDRAPFYEVGIGPTSAWCSCRGFTLSNDERRPCKHISALRHLIETKVLTDESETGDE